MSGIYLTPNVCIMHIGIQSLYSSIKDKSGNFIDLLEKKFVAIGTDAKIN